MLLRPLSFPEPERLVRIWETTRDGDRFSFSAPNYLDVRARSRTLEAVAAYGEVAGSTVLTDGEPQRISAVPVSASFGDVLGVRPQIGRLFTADADRAGNAERFIVLSDGLWRGRFGGDAQIVGRVLAVGGVPYLDLPAMTIVVRSDRTLAALAPELRAVVRDADPTLPAASIQAVAENRAALAAGPRFNLWLLGAFSIVALVLAVTGVYAVLAFTVAERRREIAVRVALGATGASIARLVLRTGLGLTTAGLAAGIVAAFGATRVLAGLLYDVSPIDPLTFAGAAGILHSATIEKRSSLTLHVDRKVRPHQRDQHEGHEDGDHNRSISTRTRPAARRPASTPQDVRVPVRTLHRTARYRRARPGGGACRRGRSIR